jgi:putative transposase
MCQVFNISRSGYYEWTKRQESSRQQRRQEWEKQIRRVFLDSRQLYGSPKVWQALMQQGIQISLTTVTRIMKDLGLKSRTVRKYKATTNSKHNLPVADNVLNQQFATVKPNKVWVVDITYIPTDEGWLYVAGVEDLCTRKIVGFHMGERMTKSLVVEALKQAYQVTTPSRKPHSPF